MYETTERLQGPLTTFSWDVCIKHPMSYIDQREYKVRLLIEDARRGNLPRYKVPCIPSDARTRVLNTETLEEMALPFCGHSRRSAV